MVCAGSCAWPSLCVCVHSMNGLTIILKSIRAEYDEHSSMAIISSMVNIYFSMIDIMYKSNGKLTDGLGGKWKRQRNIQIMSKLGTTFFYRRMLESQTDSTACCPRWRQEQTMLFPILNRSSYSEHAIPAVEYLFIRKSTMTWSIACKCFSAPLSSHIKVIHAVVQMRRMHRCRVTTSLAVPCLAATRLQQHSCAHFPEVFGELWLRQSIYKAAPQMFRFRTHAFWRVSSKCRNMCKRNR